MSTFAVGVVEDGNGQRRMVATMNDGTPNPRADAHMKENGIEPLDTKPHIGSRPVKNEDGTPARHPNGDLKNETIDMDTAQTNDKGKKDKSTADPFDKSERSDHHAEQRMERGGTVEDPDNAGQRKDVPGPGEKVVAQSPSQPCCSGCQKALGTPNSQTGEKPIDKIPADRQKKPPRAPKPQKTP